MGSELRNDGGRVGVTRLIAERPLRHGCRGFGVLFAAVLMLMLVSGCADDGQPQGPPPAGDARTLYPVTVADFEAFVRETGYVTDAERYGWSVVQLDVVNYTVVDGANWRIPDGLNPPQRTDLPVTQVSYQDAQAYADWAGATLPTYLEYWGAVATDTRPIIENGRGPISPVDSVNVVGNVWDITQPDGAGNVRLAGGSLFCAADTCHGTSQDRELYVDIETGNIHIGFSVFR